MRVIHDLSAGTSTPDPNWVHPTPVRPAPTVDDVRREAARRILAICPEWKQRNLTARAAELSKQIAEGTALTAEQQAEWDAGQAIWDQIKAIRAASDAMEADPPADFRADSRWP